LLPTMALDTTPSAGTKVGGWVETCQHHLSNCCGCACGSKIAYTKGVGAPQRQGCTNLARGRPRPSSNVMRRTPSPLSRYCGPAAAAELYTASAVSMPPFLDNVWTFLPEQPHGPMLCLAAVAAAGLPRADKGCPGPHVIIDFWTGTPRLKPVQPCCWFTCWQPLSSGGIPFLP
jgi:hypothetical protein